MPYSGAKSYLPARKAAKPDADSLAEPEDAAPLGGLGLGRGPRRARSVTLMRPPAASATAVVEAVVRPVVLHIGLPGRDDLLRGVVQIVSVMRGVALDVEDDLAA